MVQYNYSPTELGMEVWNRGGLSPEEEAVFDSLVNLEREGDFGTIPLLQKRLVFDSKRLDQSASPQGYTGRIPSMASELRYSAGKKVHVSDPVRLRRIMTDLVRRGLVQGSK